MSTGDRLSDTAWITVNDSGYKVYRVGRVLFRYLVAGPGGSVITYTFTQAGARRAIRRRRRRIERERPAGIKSGWWNKPLVHREPAGGSGE